MAEVWVETSVGGTVKRHGGQTAVADLPVNGEPTSALIQLAASHREQNLSTAFGDARMAGADVTPFECLAAPFQVDLDDELGGLLAGSWREREPRPPAKLGFGSHRTCAIVAAAGAALDLAPHSTAIKGATEEANAWELFVEVVEHSSLVRQGGPLSSAVIDIPADPTYPLARLAYDFRLDLGVIVGDLRMAGDDVTRFEVYAAPFRIQLTDRLAHHFAGRWRYRDPLFEAGPELPAPAI